MITSTTFVVGAGASAPYGLPLGAELLKSARELSPREPLVQLLYQMFGIDFVNNWIRDLQQSPVRSLDKFVQERSDYEDFTLLGKTVIAGLMARWLEMRGRESEDWIDDVLNGMAEGVRNYREFEEANTDVCFVTFNFDWVLEARITTYLNRRFKDSVTDAHRNAFPVHHVHGRLPFAPNRALDDKDSVSLQAWRAWLEHSREQIRVVHDSDVDQDVLLDAINALTSAKLVIFLGLHYFKENLDRLRIPGEFNVQRNQRVIGSACGLSPGERSWVQHHVRGIELGGNTHTCVDVLKTFNWRSHA